MPRTDRDEESAAMRVMGEAIDAAVAANLAKQPIAVGDAVVLTVTGTYTRPVHWVTSGTVRTHLTEGLPLLVVGAAGEFSDRLLCRDAQERVFSIPRWALKKKEVV